MACFVYCPFKACPDRFFLSSNDPAIGLEVCVFIAIMLVNLVLALNTSCGQGCSQNTVDARAEHGHTIYVRTLVQNGRSN